MQHELTPLAYMARMSDHEIRDDVETCVLPALDYEFERVVARAYRRARMKAPGWRPGAPGSNNHASVPAGWGAPQVVADGLEQAASAEQTDLAGLLRRVVAQVARGGGSAARVPCEQCGRRFVSAATGRPPRFCGARCRVAAHRAKAA